MDVLFHLAFPVHDINLAKTFYVEQLGCQLGRESEQALILNFASHQIVAHKIDFLPEEQKSIYPRHFGLVFLDKTEFIAFIEALEKRGMNFEIPLKIRFADTRLEHHTFFLKDPSNNLLEFKYYRYQSAIFGEKNFKKIGESI
ncbi:VOC family protein [Legionella sp. km772]|uniref:VOC family protein n=1 Tax=Legionella sp. km772 TaxID=2498111 RepID=UPI000F8E59F9|nr:VOC family protein [Legionella sp. km772]RUR12078.1 glyoxalase [Legionella sp. km772]